MTITEVTARNSKCFVSVNLKLNIAVDLKMNIARSEAFSEVDFFRIMDEDE